LLKKLFIYHILKLCEALQVITSDEHGLILGHQTLDPDPDPHLEKMVDPDPH
jgi:hypothetical protein